MGEAKRRAGQPPEPEVIELLMPIKADLNLNSRVHWRVAHSKKAAQKTAVGWLLKRKRVPQEPLLVSLTRIAPGNPPDDDNVVSSLKFVRDAIADWAGIDDREKARIRFIYEDPVRGPWAVKAVISGS